MIEVAAVGNVEDTVVDHGARRCDAAVLTAKINEIEFAGRVDGGDAGVGVGAEELLSAACGDRKASARAAGYTAVLNDAAEERTAAAGDRQRLRAERHDADAGGVEKAADAGAVFGLRNVERGDPTANGGERDIERIGDRAAAFERQRRARIDLGRAAIGVYAGQGLRAAKNFETTRAVDGAGKLGGGRRDNEAVAAKRDRSRAGEEWVQWTIQKCRTCRLR
jgi:hypothetical protein